MARGVFLFAVPLSFVVVACTTTEAPNEDHQEADNTASNETDPFHQVRTCDNLFKDRAAFRDVDLEQGVLRWKCGDVDSVSISDCEDNLDKLAEAENATNVDGSRDSALRACGNGYGQEYCEYNAIAKGNIVNSVKSGTKLKESDVVQCVFTSVHRDVADPDGAFNNDKSDAFHKELAAKLKPQVTGAERDLEPRVTGMRQSVNSRSAADKLILECSGMGADVSDSSNAMAANLHNLHTNADRQVLCYRKWAAAPSAEKQKIEQLCTRVDLSDDAAFAKLGIESAELTDNDKDLAACSMTLFPKSGGVSWRNSDPTICARAYRAAWECGVSFKKIHEVAPQFQGFPMMGWTNRDVLAPGCKYAEIDGAPYKSLVVCTPSPQDVKAYRTQKKPLQQLCRDKFGVNVAMQAPIGALAKLDRAKENTPFCKAFVAGARAAQK